MVDKTFSLALSFISQEPEAAARTLEHSKVADVVEFMRQIPLDHQYEILRHLLPGYAARVCMGLGPVASATILVDLDATAVARILRLLPRPQMEAILQELPRRQRDDSAALLKYSIRFVGAWMTPHTASVPEEMSAEDALTYLRNENLTQESGYFYVINHDHVLSGRVSFVALLKANRTVRMRDLMEAGAPHLSASMLVETALELPLWNQHDTLAVTDRHQRLLGIIHHADLRRAMTQGRQSHSLSSTAPDVVSSIAGVYGKTLFVLFNNLMNVIEPDLKS